MQLPTGNDIVIEGAQNLIDQFKQLGLTYWELFPGHDISNNQRAWGASTMEPDLQLSDSHNQLIRTLSRFGHGKGILRLKPSPKSASVNYVKLKFDTFPRMVSPYGMFANPYAQNNTIGSVGSSNNDQVIGAINELKDQIQKKDLELIEFKHKVEKERLEQQIEDLTDLVKNTGNGFYQAVMRLCEMPALEPILQGIGAILATKINGVVPQNMGIGTVTQSGGNTSFSNNQTVPNMDQQNQSGASTPQMSQEEAQESLQNSLQRIQNHYPEYQVLDVLEGLANYLDNINPAMKTVIDSSLTQYLPKR